MNVLNIQATYNRSILKKKKKKNPQKYLHNNDDEMLSFIGFHF